MSQLGSGQPLGAACFLSSLRALCSPGPAPAGAVGCGRGEEVQGRLWLHATAAHGKERGEKLCK